MDNVKQILAVLKKHHFWVLAALVLILSFAGWYVASSSLAQEAETNRKKIDGEFNELSQIIARTNHPNEKFQQGTERLERNLRRDVDKAWTLVYMDQKSKVLKWPAELAQLAEWMDDPDNYEKEIPQDLRDDYWNYVKEEFPKLLEIVDARPYWDKEEDQGAMGLGPAGRRRERESLGPGNRRPQPPRREYKVIWDRRNQQLIDESLEFPKDRPTSQEVRFCQENLWVYRALLNAVARVNEGATGHHNAKVKEIISVNIGRNAAELVRESLNPGRIMGPDGTLGGFQQGMPSGMRDVEMEAGAAGPPMPAESIEGDRFGMMGREGGQTGKMLDDKRYVDEKGVPIPAGTPLGKEFKRMAIVMQLYMDQRELSNLLVNLANSPLPVEIRQLRINTKMQGFNNPRPMMFGSVQDGGMGSGRGGPSIIKRDKQLEEAAQSYDIAVELHGIIYIFNPPDRALRETLVAEGEIELSEDDAADATSAEDDEPEAKQDASGEDAAAAPNDGADTSPPADAAAGDFEQAQPDAAAENKPAGAPTEAPAAPGDAEAAPAEEP